MQFLREEQDEAIHAIADRIGVALRTGKRVLWLVSGGSNIAAEVAVMKHIREHSDDDLGGLAILPMDERYGVVGHKDSNTQQLREAGFDPGAATWIDVLMHNVSFEETVSAYNDVATTALENAVMIIGQFGLGGDGHTAGILPSSIATEDSEMMVVGYEWSDYSRMTLTPAALKKVRIAYVLAYGSGKEDALHRLQKGQESLADLPAKLLNDIPEVHVYNDFIKSEG